MQLCSPWYMNQTKICLLLSSFQNFSSLPGGKEILVEERAGGGRILVEAGNDQPNSLLSHRLCIGHLGVSLGEKQSHTKGCPQWKRKENFVYLAITMYVAVCTEADSGEQLTVWFILVWMAGSWVSPRASLLLLRTQESHSPFASIFCF